jgi:hypothetical protein
MTTLAETLSTSTYSSLPKLEPELNQVINVAISLNRIVGTVVIIAHRGTIVYQRAAGFADREARRLVQPGTIFRLATLGGANPSICRHLLLGRRLRSFLVRGSATRTQRGRPD